MGEYRNVKGYNPAEHMIQTKFEDGKESLYLPAAERVKWFNVYKNETGIPGTINERDAQLVNTPAGPVWVVDASVTIGDEEYRGRFMRPVLTCEGTLDERAFSTAYTKAIGRALAHAGFGQDEDDLRDGHDQSPLSDAPVVIHTAHTTEEKAARTEHIAPAQVKQYAHDEDNTADSDHTSHGQNLMSEDAQEKKTAEMTVEAAKAVIIEADMSSSKGNMKGKTMGELLATRPKGVAYIANHPEKYANQPDAVHAAARVLKALADEASKKA